MDVSFTVLPVHRLSSCLIQSVIKDYESHLERSDRLQLRVCMLTYNQGIFYKVENIV